MYEIKHNALTPDNFFAGQFPVVTDSGNVKEGATIRRFAPIIEGADGIEEITAAVLPTSGETATSGSLDKIIGIAAEDSDGGKVVYYCTGEFFGNALTLPEGVTAKDLKPAMRKLGIFLKELN